MQATTAVWIGIDVAKVSVEAAINLAGSPAPCASFPRTAAGMSELVAWGRSHAPQDAPLRVVLEATGRYSLEAMAWLSAVDPAITPACVNPLHAKRFAQSLGSRNKTDRADARLLARMGAEREPHAYEAPSEAITELRALVRERRALVDERTALRNRIEEGSDSALVRRERTRLLRNLERAVERMDKAIAAAVEADADLKRDVARLRTIPGVGTLTAVTVLAELGDLRRFASSRQLAAFAGLSPRQHSSGTSVHGRTRMCKKGNPAARAVLYLSALAAARTEGALRDTYRRLTAAGKPPMSALGALMRKQLILMRALLVTGQDYRKPCG
jgi:transposase